MDIRLLSSPDDLALYEAWVQTHPQGTLWQSLSWKRYQEALGRETRVYGALEGSKIVASALVIIDKTTFGLSTWDMPRGPLGPHGMENEQTANGKRTMQSHQLLQRILQDAKKDRCFALYLSPVQELSAFHFPFSISPRHEQPEATRILDLTLSEDQILAQMHQKGRYNIKVAERHGVTVEESQDIDAFYTLLQSTADRDGFQVGPRKRYEKFLKELPGSFLLIALVDGSPIAGLLGITCRSTTYYYYGASSYTHRALMAPYLLQWKAMKRAKALGCTQYDLLGISPLDAPSDHPWVQISAFKEKFGGAVVTYPPEQRIVLKPLISVLLNIKRRIL